MGGDRGGRLLFLVLLVLLSLVSATLDAVDPPEPRQDSATEMFFRGGCRNLQRTSTKLVWTASSNCEPIDDPTYTFLVSEDCVRDKPTEFGHSGSSEITSRREGLIHTKYASNDCTGTAAETVEIIVDKCVQFGKADENGGGSYIWRRRTGPKKAVYYGQYHDKDCKVGVSPTEIPNIFVLEGCHEIGKLECFGGDLKLIAQRAGSSKECLEADTFGVFESIGSACAASDGASRFRLPNLSLLFAVVFPFAGPFL